MGLAVDIEAPQSTMGSLVDAIAEKLAPGH
jgi:hypothetical protein